MRCKVCGMECCCSISHRPPCAFCESHGECEICGKVVCSDEAVELKHMSDGSSIRVCPQCAAIEVDT